MRFPYYQIGPSEFEPIITLKLLGKKGWLETEAYIDSGASFSVFHAERAEILQLEYTKGKRVLLTVGDGGLLEVYIHKLPVDLGGTRFPAEIGFSPQLGVGFNLLGRRSFFDRFQICFDDKHRFLEFHPLS